MLMRAPADGHAVIRARAARILGLVLAAFAAILSFGAGPAQAANESEPNGDAASANAIAPGETVTGASTASDLDWFRFTAGARGLALVQLSGGAPAAGFYNATLEPIASQRREPYGGPVEYTLILGSAGAVYIQLTPYAPGNYSFTVTLTAGFAAIQGSGELEYNDAPGNATQGSEGGRQEGLFDARYPTDVDWWRFAVPGAGTLLASVDVDGLGIEYRAASDLSRPSPIITGIYPDGVRLGFVFAGPETLLLEVRPGGWTSTVRYGLVWEFNAGWGALEGPDEVERNDDGGSANAVPLNATVRGYVAVAFGDRDFWSFDAPDGGVAVVRLDANSASATVFGWPGLLPVDNASRYLPSGGVEISFEVLSPRGFVVHVSDWLAVTGYSLTISFFPGSSSFEGPDEREPNDDRADATNAPLNVTLVGAASSLVNDVDYWRVEFPEAGLADVGISSCCNPGWYGTAEYPLALEITRAPDGGPVYAGQRLPCSGCGIVQGIFLGGPLSAWLRITALGHFIGTYTLRVDFSTDFGPVEGADEIEPNNGPANATPFELSVAAQGLLDQAHIDGDWWQFTSPLNGWAGLKFDSPNGSISTRVTDEHGTEVLGHTSDWDMPYVFQVVAATKYVVMAGAYVGAYNITVTIGPTRSWFSAGPGEAEPNDAASAPQTLAANVTVQGAMRADRDTADYFAVAVEAGDFVWIHVGQKDAFFGLGVGISAQPAAVFPGLARSGGFPLDLRLFARQSGVLIVGVELSVDTYSAGSLYGGSYDLQVRVEPTATLADGVLSLSELVGDDRFGLVLQPFDAQGVSPLGMSDAEGRIYGFSMCLRHGLSNAVGPAAIEAGQIFEPEGAARRMVAAGSPRLEVLSGEPACFRALELESRMMTKGGTIALPGGFVDGDARMVIATCALEGEAGMPGLLALWAVTSEVSLKNLTVWQVDRNDVIHANGLLERSGVPQRLPVPPEIAAPQPPAPGNGTSVTPGGPTVSGALNAALFGGILGAAVAATAAGLYLVGKQQRKGGQRPSTAGEPTAGWPPAGLGAIPNTQLPPPPAPTPLEKAFFDAHPGHPACPRCGAPLRPGLALCARCRFPL